MKIMVGIPTYDGKIQAQVLQSILNEQVAAKEVGDSLIFNILPNCSHAAMGRNQLARTFMLSNCDRLVFLDADVSFEFGSLLKIAHFEEPFVGGAYRYKLENELYPVGWLEGDLWSNENGLLEVSNLPGGFLSLSREVFEKLEKEFPRPYTFQNITAQCHFQMKYEDGQLWGEDSYFCREWRSIGEKVYLYPELTLTHWRGDVPFVGNIGQWLLSRGK